MTRWAEASGTIQLLSVEPWGFSQKEYIETTTKGSMSGGMTTAAVIVPRRLTASSPESASASNFVLIHSTSTRFESLAMAVRRGHATHPAVRHGAGST